MTFSALGANLWLSETGVKLQPLDCQKGHFALYLKQCGMIQHRLRMVATVLVNQFGFISGRSTMGRIQLPRRLIRKLQREIFI